MAPQPVREANGASASYSTGAYSSSRVVQTSHQTQETRSSGTMSSLMCCTSTRSQKVMGYKEGQKKFLWLDPNRWSGQKTVKKEKVRPNISLDSSCNISALSNPVILKPMSCHWALLSLTLPPLRYVYFISTRTASKIDFMM